MEICGTAEDRASTNMEKLMNEENEWNHSISATVKEGPADCIRIDEVAAALKKPQFNTERSSSPYHQHQVIMFMDLNISSRFRGVD